jgi:trimeric autotransporter adhesin
MKLFAAFFFACLLTLMLPATGFTQGVAISNIGNSPNNNTMPLRIKKIPALALSAAADNWNTTGNEGTNPAINFIGTTDAQPLRFRVNNIWAGEINPANSNSFFGLNSGGQNTAGFANTATGESAMFSNTTGRFNCANGQNALYFNTTGYNNTAIGSSALYYNNIGNSNTANGGTALYFNTTGNSNTANGASALLLNTTGSYNAANGANTLTSNYNGNSNTADGYGALYANYTGSNNTANGAGALSSNTSGNYNTAIGVNALKYNTTGYNNIAIGYNAGTHPSTSFLYNTISIGNDSYLNGYYNQAFIGNLSTMWNGGNKPWSTYSDARMKNSITDDVKGLDFILRLKPVTYYRSIKAALTITGSKEMADFPGKYDVEKIKESGFLAQQVEQAAKDAGYDFSGVGVPKNTAELYTLSYEQFVVPLVKAMQEQQALIQNQQKQIELLQKRLTALECPVVNNAEVYYNGLAGK